MARPKREWTERDDSRLIDMFNAKDLTIRQIANTLGCSVSRVRKRLQDLRDQGRVGLKRAPARGVKGEATAAEVAFLDRVQAGDGWFLPSQGSMVRRMQARGVLVVTDEVRRVEASKLIERKAVPRG